MQDHPQTIVIASRFGRSRSTDRPTRLRSGSLILLLASLAVGWGSTLWSSPAVVAGAGSTTAPGRHSPIPLQLAEPTEVDRQAAAGPAAAPGVPVDEIRLDEETIRRLFTPSIIPTHGRLSSRFGYREDPVVGGRRFHRGLDISAPPGEPVFATADGVVSRAGYRGGLGRSVSISHGFGLVTSYSHLASTKVTEGSEVRRGEVIGHVGSSGRATGYHLHYEVFDRGRPVDPLAYLPRRPRT